MTNITEITIPNYATTINLTNKRRKAYYKITDKLPKKYQKNLKNYKIIDGYYVDKNTGERIIKNANSCDKPRMYKISGQDLWSTINPHIRSKISRELKQYFYNQLEPILAPIDDSLYPVGVRLIFYNTIEGEDLDNHALWYRKVINDVLCGHVEYEKDENGKYVPVENKYKKMLIDDSKQYIQQIPVEFVPIEKDEERQLTVQIFSLN